MSEITSTEIDYSTKVNNHSTIIYRKLNPQGASTQIALSSSSTVGPVEVVLGPSVFNPSKCRLNFQLELPDPGATVKASWLNANALSIFSRVVVYDANTNNLLLDCSNLEKYAAMVVPASTSFAEFSTKSGNTQQGTYAQKMPITSAGSTPYPFEDIGKSNSLVNVSFDNTALAGTTGVNSFQGRKQLYVGTDTEKSFIDFSIPFSAFKHTFMALNKNVYSPSNLIFQFYLNATDNFAWYSASVTDPTSGTAVSIPATAYINTFNLEIANENNLQIVSQVINNVMSPSGVSIPIAYPTCVRQSLASSTSHSYQLVLSRAYGQRILAIVTAPFNVGATINVRNEHKRDVLGVYNKFLNGVAINYPNGIDATLGEDWKYDAKEYCEDSAIQTLGEYWLAEWFTIDSFVGSKPLSQLDMTLIDGLDVGTQSSTWQIQAALTSATAYVWVTAILGQKIATFSASGVMVQ
tara:strand:+ start:1159 stop:2553 length:1395 start_codon:yes stop_codon:yes gene_type:complete